MDGRRFDQFTRLLSNGTSRRSIVKGLLGLGGIAVTGSQIDEAAGARTARTRPTIPPPPPPGPTTTTSTTAAPCPGQEQCANSSLCCPIGTCARSGAAAICCDGTLGHGDTVCGLECCQDPQQCCDGECCGEMAVCLNRVFPGVPEEYCCPAALTCDDGCCDGECYVPLGAPLTINGFPIADDFFDRECCPPGGTVCQGDANASCCDDRTEQCCQQSGIAFCAPIEGCCDAEDCLPLPADSDPCTVAVCSEAHICEYPSCPEGQDCCVNAPEPVCLDLRVEGVCCTTQHCENGCDVCEATVCTALCEGNACCMTSTDPAEWFCIPDGGCCEDSECPGEGTRCCRGDCLSGPCCEDDDCDSPETCCILGDLSICLDLTIEGSCCRADQCPPPDGECLVATCLEFQCGETGDPNCCNPQCGIGQRCCPAGYCIPFDKICCNAQTEDEDCPAGHACCGGFCQPGECCTGIADDGRCGAGSTCCFDPAGNFCTAGTTCPTTTSQVPTTSTTTTTTTQQPGCNPTSCAAQDRCDGAAWLSHTCIGDSCTETRTVCQDSDICTENFCTEGVGCETRLRTDTCNPSQGIVCCPFGWDCLVTTNQCSCSSGNICSDGTCGNLCCTASDCQSQEMGVIPCVDCVAGACVAVNNGAQCQGTGTCNDRFCQFQ